MSLSFRTSTPVPAFRLDPRVGSVGDVVEPRRKPRLRRRREIVAVIDPAWSALGGDVTDSVRAPQPVAEEAASRLVEHLQPGEVVAASADGKLTMRLKHEDRASRPVRLQEMAYHCIEALDASDAPDRTTDLGIGWSRITRHVDPARAERQARGAAAESGRQRDLQPRHHDGTRRQSSVRITWRSAGFQIFMATIGSIVLPFLGLVGLHHLGFDPSSLLYWILVGALGITAATIWAECLHALDPPKPPARRDGPAPRASAVIAAYLPNEADTIVETIHSFLAQAYSGGLQIVVAYNTPTPLPVEDELADLARRHDDLVVVKVNDSTSKAQNVNAALRVTDGEFVGIFDADHHPMAGAFDRAWQWLGDGVDVVQGHCVIRNGDDSALAKLVAVEFEQIYAVAHPGRAALHGFGIFGGSNGYWSADALRRIRLRGSFLTEDIEASMRLLERGGTIVNDPGLISYELAPETPRALWKQRMRWAQGWFQVSCRHLAPVLRSDHLSLRQKVGATYLMGWREIYPWVSLMALPLLGFLAWRDGGLDFSSPMFLLISLFVTVSGPLQALVGWRLAAPEIKQHPWWFVGAALASLVAYTELKNLINRVAHLKQMRGEHQWIVTPRSAQSTASSAPSDDTEVYT
ncbi:MAG: response regulator receiver modulated diguanylate cyclase [Aeromicrobium sp.]|uniref:glycosyltransferase n=1 Tax=Aeromicrobium sp. TaxID=1871063 RepID=UPI0026067C5E|nr:glycosyltransferase family 2 protein [Aeromicrobium sp.]MCW2789453.1 response regulator receiver modulated diguanylate cyclase [Aeromicrobium sp.]MCW2826262.1 response regulator receiver modulated diguanylate cyclase [Aeromicrobium sp.]